MNHKELELSLLFYWKHIGVERIYKYKHMIKEHRHGQLYNTDLLMTIGDLFYEIHDKAIEGWTEKNIFEIDELINSRKGESE